MGIGFFSGTATGCTTIVELGWNVLSGPALTVASDFVLSAPNPTAAYCYVPRLGMNALPAERPARPEQLEYG